jgi:hypothetical protein
MPENPYQSPSTAGPANPVNTWKAGLALILLLYGALPALMWYREGFHEGFLPTLLWPLPVFIFLACFGFTPLWAAEFGAVAFLAVWIVEVSAALLVGRLVPRYRKTVILVTYGMFVFANLGLWIVIAGDIS